MKCRIETPEQRKARGLVPFTVTSAETFLPSTWCRVVGYDGSTIAYAPNFDQARLIKEGLEAAPYVSFAIDTLARLENDESWSAETLESIADEARNRGLAKDGDDGLFAAVYPDDRDKGPVEFTETPAGERAREDR